MNAQPGGGRPDWLSKLVLPIAVAVVGAILVTALTPLGDNLRELLFPTKADVSGTVTVSGMRAAGARLVLDGEPVGAADDEGTFVLRDVGDGSHTLEIKAVSSRLKRQQFTVERQASAHALGEIQLVPLAELGWDPSISPTAGGLTYDVTLWIIAERDVLDRIRSVQYTFPAPFPPTVETVSAAPASAFCLRHKGTFRTSGARPPAADVDLGEGRRFPVASPGPGEGSPPDCPLTGGGNGSSSPPASPPPSSPPPPVPPPQPPPSSPPPPATAVVPPVTGESFEAAQAAVAAEGFRVVRKDVVSDQPVGTVVAQAPKEGTSKPRGSTVTLSVSAGAAVVVPDVTGLTSADAREKLEGSGFKVEVQDRLTDDKEQDGDVLEQSPAPGEETVRGSKVTIVVGRLGGR